MSTRKAIQNSMNANGLGLEQVFYTHGQQHIVRSGFGAVGRKGTLNPSLTLEYLLPSQWVLVLAPYSFLLRSEYQFTLHQNWHRTFPICDALHSSSARHSFAL